MSQYSDSAFTEDTNSSWFKAFNYITAKSSVLDIGCSSGHFGEVLIDRKKCIVDGVELDKNDFETAKKKLRNVYRLNIETDDLSAIEQKYDYIYLGDVIEHLVHPIESLTRIKGLLKPTGKLVFSIPNMSHISVRLMLLKGDLIYGKTGLLDVTHLHFYTHNEVQRVFSGAGYVISELDPVLIDYPEELVAKELGFVGLEVTDKFMGFARKTEASVYQFVGYAQPQSNKTPKNKTLGIVSPVDKFQLYLNETKKYYEGLLHSNTQHIDKLELLTKDLSDELDQTKHKLEKSISNRTRKLLKKVRKPSRNT